MIIEILRIIRPTPKCDVYFSKVIYYDFFIFYSPNTNFVYDTFVCQQFDMYRYKIFIILVNS